MPLWLWCRPAAIAAIQPLPWELPYAMGAALEKGKKEKEKKKYSQVICCVRSRMATVPF